MGVCTALGTRRPPLKPTAPFPRGPCGDRRPLSPSPDRGERRQPLTGRPRSVKQGAADAYKGRNCRLASAQLILPDPYVADKVLLRTSEPVSMLELNPDAPNDGADLTVHDGWIETGTPITLLGGDGKPVEARLVDRAQAQSSQPREGPLMWELELEITEEQLRHLQSVGWAGWSYQAKARRFTHYVKKAY